MRGSALELYSHVARRSAARVIGGYSTSFGLASLLLGSEVREHVANVYALVRVADEIVDGTAQEAGLDVESCRTSLTQLEQEVEHALTSGFSPNLVVHAFGRTARHVGFGTELTAPFFASMRRDLDPVALTESEFATYVHGSAEVVGVMCLRAFLLGHEVDDGQRARLELGARHLGAAFQKINFLRDLGEDYLQRDRRYFPGVDPAHITEEQKVQLLADIETDLAAAARTIPELPPSSRRGVAAACALFTALVKTLHATPASRLLTTRVSVPTVRKAAIWVGAAVRPTRSRAGALR
ncbi:phytoene/squalene synthase family protein [Propionibacteriaceae bacterium Y2011]|uniref:phytoene/squalene synthase family protein n=1 Tax=Microlunatus sp. Y2014 TaxID=3418488 RepID=UPI003B46F9A3